MSMSISSALNFKLKTINHDYQLIIINQCPIETELIFCFLFCLSETNKAIFKQQTFIFTYTE